MAALPRAVLQQLDPVRIILLVLARRVVPLLALRARELDDRTRLNSSHGASLRDDADDGAGTDGAAALADGEALADLEGDRGDQLDRHLDVVAGHDHLRAVGQADRPGDVAVAAVLAGAVRACAGGGWWYLAPCVVVTQSFHLISLSTNLIHLRI